MSPKNQPPSSPSKQCVRSGKNQQRCTHLTRNHNADCGRHGPSPAGGAVSETHIRQAVALVTEHSRVAHDHAAVEIGFDRDRPADLPDGVTWEAAGGDYARGIDGEILDYKVPFEALLTFDSPENGNLEIDLSGLRDVELLSCVRAGDGDGDITVRFNGQSSNLYTVNVSRKGNGNGDAKAFHDDAPTPHGASYYMVNVERTGGGDGDAVNDGKRDGHVERTGSGNGNAVRTGAGEGMAARTGSGDGDAVRTDAGDGGARRVGSGDGDAVRLGYGHGVAYNATEGVGNAVREGWVRGDCKRETPAGRPASGEAIVIDDPTECPLTEDEQAAVTYLQSFAVRRSAREFMAEAAPVLCRKIDDGYIDRETLYETALPKAVISEGRKAGLRDDVLSALQTQMERFVDTYRGGRYYDDYYESPGNIDQILDYTYQFHPASQAEDETDREVRCGVSRRTAIARFGDPAVDAYRIRSERRRKRRRAS